MGLKEINLNPVYYSDENNLLQEFYIPVLSNSVKYDRIAGYFSSNSLAIAAKGIAAFIKAGGRIRLIANVVLSEKDQEAIKKALLDKEKEVLTEIENLEDQIKKDHIRMLGWMIKNNLLEIKIAVVKNGIEHQKIGVLEDSNGNKISFSGSDNETVQGWLRNDEQFHVFCGWKEGDRAHLLPDVDRFNCLWQDKGRRVRVYSVSNAFKMGLIQSAPSEDLEFEKLSVRITDELLQKNALRYGYYKKTRKIKLRDYQQVAITNWLDNDRKGIFEMATGTGKTFTALGCILRILFDKAKLVTVITAPYHHLVQQWRREMDKFKLTFDRYIVADSTNPTWKNKLADYLTDITLGYKKTTVVFTTHNTFSSKDFCKIIAQNKQGFELVLVADEVHGIGASTTKLGLLEAYDYKLGMSATPRRWFDDVGTKAIYDYFGRTVFEFTLEDAINTINPDTNETYLTPYQYLPVFVSLSEDELEQYVDLTHSIVKRLGKSNLTSEDEIGQLLLFKRANIIKNATSKYSALEDVICELERTIQRTIVYSSPIQIDSVLSILNKHGIRIGKFTMKEGTRPSNRYGGRSEREFILDNFATGDYQVLVAMRCLDEGVDIPEATTAIIMASSGNPREYIQRIGRVIRRYPGKNIATIYDMIVIPSLKNIPRELRKFEYSVFEKEIARYEEIARLAVNNAVVLIKVYEFRERILGGTYEWT